MIMGVTPAHLGPIWYHSEPSEVPYLPSQFLGWDFFCSKTALDARADIFVGFLAELKTPQFPFEIA